MTPRGAEALIDLRKRRGRIARPVWISFGDYRDPDWHRYAECRELPELVIRQRDPIERLDLRCVFGLPVTLFLPTWTDAGGLLFERLQEYASEITVMSPAFDDDIGWFWTRKTGQIDFNEQWRFHAIEEAQQNRMAAAVKRDQKAYETWKAKEIEAAKGASWLN